jgi:hypothetical protein
MTSVELRTDGPHSPEYTRELGDGLAEIVRCLNYATRDVAPGLRYPRDADRLLRDITVALDRVPQLLEQIRAWLRSRSHAGRIGHDQGDDAVEAVTAADAYLLDVIPYLEDVTDRLREAAAQTSHLTDTTPGDD